MDISNLVTNITAKCPTAAQVMKAEDISREFVDTSQIIFGLVSPSVSGRAYPSKLPGNKTFPALVYSLVSSNKISFSQFNILQTDVFIVYFQATTYIEIMTLRESIKSSLVNYNVAATAGDIEITDESIDYLPDQQLHQCALELNIVHLNGLNQAIPAVLVYESNNGMPANEMINTVVQWREVELNIDIVAKHEQLETIRREVEAAVLGYREASYGAGTEAIGGSRLESLVNVSVWEQRYKLKQRPMIVNR